MLPLSRRPEGGQGIYRFLQQGKAVLCPRLPYPRPIQGEVLETEIAGHCRQEWWQVTDIYAWSVTFSWLVHQRGGSDWLHPIHERKRFLHHRKRKSIPVFHVPFCVERNLAKNQHEDLEGQDLKNALVILIQSTTYACFLHQLQKTLRDVYLGKKWSPSLLNHPKRIYLFEA